MRSRIWSALWLRLFLSLIVVGAVFSSPIPVAAPYLTLAPRPAHSHAPRPIFRSHHGHHTGTPDGVRRVRFLNSLQDAGDEIAAGAPLPIWSFQAVSLLTPRQWHLMPSSVLPLSSLPLLC
jgi:hypothetical protein